MLNRLLTTLPAFLLFASSAVFAQATHIHGRVTINPQVDDPTDIVLEVRQTDDGPSVMEITVDQYSPHRFNAFLTSGLSGDFIIKVLVKIPGQYSSWQAGYKKLACCEFNQDIILKRKSDVYAEFMNRAAKSANHDEAGKLLQYASDQAETPAQTLEVQRQLANVLASDGKFEDQQAVLTAVKDSVDLSKFGPAKRRVYWTERLDGALKWADYNKLKNPEQDFGQVLTSDTSDPRLENWKSFVRDFKTAYPGANVNDSKFDAIDLTDQLKAVKDTLQTK